jgi:hypothetical protein
MMAANITDGDELVKLMLAKGADAVMKSTHYYSLLSLDISF